MLPFLRVDRKSRCRDGGERSWALEQGVAIGDERDLTVGEDGTAGQSGLFCHIGGQRPRDQFPLADQFRN
jgi:hypothetical protein